MCKEKKKEARLYTSNKEKKTAFVITEEKKQSMYEGTSTVR